MANDAAAGMIGECGAIGECGGIECGVITIWEGRADEGVTSVDTGCQLDVGEPLTGIVTMVGGVGEDVSITSLNGSPEENEDEEGIGGGRPDTALPTGEAS